MFQMKSVEMVHWDFWQRLTVPLDAQIVTIIGPNGSGKTTLLDAMRTLPGGDRLPSEPLVAVNHVWCAPDKGAAWRDWMLRGVPPPAAGPSCETPFAAIERLAESMGIGATPALVAADGRKHAGALPAAELSVWLGPVGAAPRDAATTTVKTPAR